MGIIMARGAHMRLRRFGGILLLVCGMQTAGENRPEFAEWDGKESTAEYARRVNLPAELNLDLGTGVSLQLALVPAGKFMMGTPNLPAPPAAYYFVYAAAGASGLIGIV